MSTSTSKKHDASSKIVPAYLDFLAIYNPALGTTEQTERNQIVFYYNVPPRGSPRSKLKVNERQTREEQDEQLRQVGLAQGIVNFARSFSNEEAVDSVETEKHRIIIKELEQGWWTLASIKLTRLPASTSALSAADSPKASLSGVYSSREVSPPAVLLEELLRAHAIFLLHHSPSLDKLFSRVRREQFCNLLDSFWTPFAQNWNVLLHGNPAVDVYGGIKLAAGGELGIGVGEEEWGSGEREVLEGLVRHTEGLVDLTVWRYGEITYEDTAELLGRPLVQQSKSAENSRWIGVGGDPSPNDGLIFSGVGCISRASLRSLSAWTRWIYTYGENAYGVRNNPLAVRRKRRRARRKSADRSLEDISATPTEDIAPSLDNNSPPSSMRQGSTSETRSHRGGPPPIVSAVEDSLRIATSDADAKQVTKADSENAQGEKSGNGLIDPDVWVKYLTLGYGLSWFGKKGPDQVKPGAEEPGAGEAKQIKPTLLSQPFAGGAAREGVVGHGSSFVETSGGCFIIGLRGELDRKSSITSEGNYTSSFNGDPEETGRLSLRTIHVELTKQAELYNKKNDEDDEELNDRSTKSRAQTSDSSFTMEMEVERSTEYKRLRVVVYVRQPFIFTLLFDPNTNLLSMPAFFTDLHQHLSPLQKPLLASTSPENVAFRVQNSVEQQTLRKAQQSQAHPMYDLIFDPAKLTIHCSIPNIPPPGTLAAEGLNASATMTAQPPPWTRVEALNVHAQILNTFSDTRRHLGERERNGKTAKGWWIVWMRLTATKDKRAADGSRQSESAESQDCSAHEMLQQPDEFREAILVRKTTEYAAPQASIGTRFGRESGTSLSRWVGRGSSRFVEEGSSALGPVKTAEGIGVDARRYVEGLLSLNR